MHELHVVGLNEILDEQLPVRSDLPEVDGDEVVEPSEIQSVEPLPERGDEVLERRRGPVQVDEYPVVPLLRPHGRESVPSSVETFRRRAGVPPAEVGSDVERAVEPVRPGVIRAANRPSHVAGGVDELQAPVPAHVVKRPHPLLRVAYQQYRLPGNGHRKRIARAGQLVDETGEYPRPGEDVLVLEREECIACVRGARQTGGHRTRGLERSQRFGSQD